MRTTFGGIEIAKRALQAQQRSLDIVGHNVANVNTPGYARQVAVHTSSQPYPIPQLTHNPSIGMMGTGVDISQISRMRDEFVEMRLRQENHNLGYWQSLNNGMEQVELIFNEPSENGIHHALDMYWDSLNQLSRNPESEANRVVVLQTAEALAENIRHVRTQLGKLRENMNVIASVKVEEINSIAQQISELNGQIGKVTVAGYQPNDLLDKRDELLQRLSEITNIEVVEGESKQITVSISGATLVDRTRTYKLETAKNSDHGYEQVTIHWEGSNSPVEISDGELYGILVFRDGLQDSTENVPGVQGYIEQLNKWIASFINTVNDIHRTGIDLEGKDGVDFFSIESSSSVSGNVSWEDDPSLLIQVNISDPNEIAASSERLDGNVVRGNGAVALKLASLRHTAYEQDMPTLNDSYNAIISGLGVRSKESKVMVENGIVLRDHLERLRESISGVSLDEEMADMIRFQHAYVAAARIMTVMDEALDTLINRLGIVGR